MEGKRQEPGILGLEKKTTQEIPAPPSTPTPLLPGVMRRGTRPSALRNRILGNPLQVMGAGAPTPSTQGEILLPLESRDPRAVLSLELESHIFL